MTKKSVDQDDEKAMERMNKALKAALETPPRKHADEPKRKDPREAKGQRSK